MYSSQVFPIELWQIIFDFSEIKEQVYLRTSQVELYTNIDIVDLYNIPSDLSKKLSDKVLRNYPKLEVLHADYNEKITTVKHLKNLRELHARHCCGISDKGIDNPKLEVLDASDNENITVSKHILE